MLTLGNECVRSDHSGPREFDELPHVNTEDVVYRSLERWMNLRADRTHLEYAHDVLRILHFAHRAGEELLNLVDESAVDSVLVRSDEDL
jgi:hypothetical protein